MIIEESIYLEHFGIKGMRWGVKNKKTSVSKPKKKLTKEQRQMRNISRALIGIKLVAGAMFLAAALSDKRANTIPKNRSYKSPSVEQVIRNTQKTQVSSLTRMHKEGKMDAEQYKNFKKILDARFDRKVADALKNT